MIAHGHWFAEKRSGGRFVSKRMQYRETNRDGLWHAQKQNLLRRP
jgi:hypothetical protein